MDFPDHVYHYLLSSANCQNGFLGNKYQIVSTKIIHED